MKNLRSKLGLFIISCFILTSCFENDHRKDHYWLYNATEKNIILEVRLLNDSTDIFSLVGGENINFFTKSFLPPNGHEFYYKGNYIGMSYNVIDSVFVIMDSIVVKKYGFGGTIKTPVRLGCYQETKKISKRESIHTYTFLPEDFE